LVVPKEQAFFRRLLVLQDDAEVAYSRIVSISVDPPEVNAAFARRPRGPLDIPRGSGSRRPDSAGSSRGRTDTLHDPYVPAVFVIDPGRRIQSAYNGYWYWGQADAQRTRARPPRAHPDASHRLGRPDALSRYWLALIEETALAPDAAAPAFKLDGRPAGTLAAWRQRAKPVRHALRVDERMIDPAGSPAFISLVLPPPGVRLPFDDLAVQQARRRVLVGRFPDAVSTLLQDGLPL
jgi:hypothetical protein